MRKTAGRLFLLPKGFKPILFQPSRVMLRLSRAITWLKRIGHGRGFGVQSPNDYRFLRNVINERLPYYKYEDLRKSVACADPHQRKMCQLYFRLANHAQADYLLELNDNADGGLEYMTAACSKTKPLRFKLPVNSIPEECVGKVVIARCSCRPEVEPILQQVLHGCDQRSIVVIDHIYDDKTSRQFWERMANAEQVRVAYDLYHCGILLMEPRRYKKKYFVNY